MHPQPIVLSFFYKYFYEFILKEKVFTPSAGVCTLNVGATTPTPPANEIPYYMHMMRVLGNYEFPITVTASGTTLTASNHILRKNSQVRFSGTIYTVTYINGDSSDTAPSEEAVVVSADVADPEEDAYAN